VSEEPVPVYEMEAAFAAELPAPPATGEPLDARTVWEAFVRFAGRRVVSGVSGEQVLDELLQFEVAPGKVTGSRTRPPAVDLVRFVGIADAGGDYLRMEQFVCELRFEHDAEAVAAVAAPAVQAGFAPDRAPGALDAFVSRIQGERAFRVLIEGCRPSGMVTSGPRPPGPLGPP
jgi:hypothetical protein